MRPVVGPDARETRDAGMVTAETALALPAVVLVLALALTGVRVAIDEIRCVDAARAGARAAARGDPAEEVEALARRAAPTGASITTSVAGGDVTVTVVAPSPTALVVIPAPSATAVAAVEGAS